jgi:hypothetical protein
MSNDDIAALAILERPAMALESIRACRSPFDAVGRTGSNILRSGSDGAPISSNGLERPPLRDGDTNV